MRALAGVVLVTMWVPACGGHDPRDPVDATVERDAALADARPDAASEPLPACAQPILTLMADVPTGAPGPDSNGYHPPPATDTASLAHALERLLAGDREAARDAAESAGYALCREDEAVLLRPTGSDGRAWIAVRTGAARPILVGIPHPRFDTSTLDEGLLGWTTWSARALVVSGTHRCANPTASGCSGSTGACSLTTEPYRESDMAHAEASHFQAAHVALVAADPDLVVLSLHGMWDLGVSLSDGTTASVAGTSLLARAAQALATALPGESITACSAGAGVVEDARLCATTNTQGRLVNGSPSPCTQAAPSATGRFLHLEQSLTVRQSPTLVIDALDPVLP